MAASVAQFDIVKVNGSKIIQKKDLLAVEEPLEIRVSFGPEKNRNERSISITMRTPGHDFELAMGFLISEGIVQHASDIEAIRYCETVEKEEEKGNVVKVQLTVGIDVDLKKLERHFYTSSSCGVCGKTSIEAVHQTSCHIIPPVKPMFKPEAIHAFPDSLREAQSVFEYTGGLHAAGLFDTKGDLVIMREDVGRHNALDKLIGAAAASDLLPLSDYLIQVSGRASFELVQKTLMAGAPILSAVGAPSSLAASLADDSGMTLLGFVRNRRFNIYTAPGRLAIEH